MGLFNKFKRATGDIKRNIDDSGVLESTKWITDSAVNKTKQTVSAMGDSRKEYRDNEIAKEEERERISQSIFAEKTSQVEGNISQNMESFLSKYTKEEISIFTKEFYEQLCIAGSNLNYSKLVMGSYISKKELSKSKKGCVEQLNDYEEALLSYPLNNREGFVLTDKNLYFAMKDVESDNLYRGIIESSKIQKFEVKEEEMRFLVLVNNVELFYLSKSTEQNDGISLKNYAERLESGDFIITERQISDQIEKKVEKKLLQRIKGFLDDGDDECIIYIAWGLDSISAKDYIVCTSKQLLIIDREMFGLGENIKQFEYKDIVSISTSKGKGMLESVISTAFKQSNLEIYVSGTSFEIESLLRIEAERVMKIVNEKKRNISKQSNNVVHESISQETPKEDVLEQLKKLAVLKDSGILNEEEFEAKKAILLERL